MWPPSISPWQTAIAGSTPAPGAQLPHRGRAPLLPRRRRGSVGVLASGESSAAEQAPATRFASIRDRIVRGPSATKFGTLGREPTGGEAVSTLKVIEIVKRRGDITRAEFREQYEGAYVPLVTAALPELSEYARLHVVAAQLPSGWEPDFDALTNHFFADGTPVERVVSVLSGAVGGEIATVASSFMDRSTHRLYRVEECVSQMPEPAEPPERKVILFSRRRDTLTRDEYRDRYENGHAVLAWRVIPTSSGTCATTSSNR